MLHHMEKTTRIRLLDTGLHLLGTVGSSRCTARATETAAGVPHGSVRHHFGNQAGFLAALVERLFEVDSPHDGESLGGTVRRWLGTDRVLTQARYEMALLATREPGFREAFVRGRDRYVDELVRAGHAPPSAAAAVAMIDGLVLDAMIRGRHEIDVEASARVLHTITTPTVGPDASASPVGPVGSDLPSTGPR